MKTHLSIELPNQVHCKIETTDAALKGQTVSSSYKPATLDNGLNIQVPPFIEAGDEIVVDTRNLEYIKKSKMISISSNLNIMIKAAEKASKSVIRDFGEVEKLQVSKKGPRDFVTKTDKHVEKILIEELSKTKKNYSFLSEEVGSIENKDKDNIWIIDPIDGTTNFLHGIPHFAICLALESKKEIISGLIYDPIKDEMFYAEKNKGAYLNNQRLRVSNKNLIDECLFSSNHEGVKFSNLNMRYSGCAALDLAYVASGRLDGFFHNKINIWDVAAGALLVKEAGGIVNDLDKFNHNNIDIRASSGAINDKMLENLKNF